MKINNEPLVSILIPSYNAEKTIKKCIECCINQTYKNIEIVIIDDCSIDDTVKIIESFKDTKIEFIKNKCNLGMSGNWNECIKHANGEYIQFLHCDDVIKNNCIEEKMKCITKNNNINMVFCDTEIINENNKAIFKRHYCNNDAIFDGYKLAHKSFKQANIFGEPSNVLFKKNILEKTGVFSNTKYSTDWEMWLKISCFGNVGYVNQYLTQYRISSTNLTSSFNISNILDDDKTMICNLNEYEYLDLSKKEIAIHRFNILFRTIARRLFIIFINWF